MHLLHTERLQWFNSTTNYQILLNEWVYQTTSRATSDYRALIGRVTSLPVFILLLGIKKLSQTLEGYMRIIAAYILGVVLSIALVNGVIYYGSSIKTPPPGTYQK
ncbi:hypothetical protein AAS21_gp118 [Pantoea phage vB_PagS_AAS21]|uniref:Uncharacterized protein n=1 Tax=Pantoea phage vB_PagS_AAS21 TaxID=2575261 RepID=A0A4Y5P1M4_9CAUD|nr:hypothetical protein AAS21_gp118 [Pantoea phage vB_PagS_AAS21]